MGKIADGIAQAIDNFFKSLKDLIMKTSGSEFFPNLLNGIHLRCVWRNEYDLNIRKSFQSSRPVPYRSITDKYNVVVRVFRRQVLQKDIHADCIAVWKNEEAAVARYRVNSTISIAILTNMMAGYTRTDPFRSVCQG